MHPINNTKLSKSFIYKHSLSTIFIIFLFLYLLLSLFYSTLYFLIIDKPLVSFFTVFQYSTHFSFNYSADKKITGETIFFIFQFLHEITALTLSTIFTAAIIIKFFYLPSFFVFKKKCNYVEKDDELIISLYNSVNMFLTNCQIRVYGREEIIDNNNIKSLHNINNNKPIFEKVYPFMETHLVTRLRINIKTNHTLSQWFKEKKVKDKKIDLIVLIEAKAPNLDSSIYEIKKYSINSNHINDVVDFYEPSPINLNYKNFIKSKGWNKFEY